jgi:hypothetical protein
MRHCGRGALRSSAPQAAVVSLVMVSAALAACDGTPLTSACKHPISFGIGGTDGINFSTPGTGHIYAWASIANARGTCLATIGGETDRISPRSYRIPVTVDFTLKIEDTSLFDTYSAGRSTVDVVASAWTDSNVAIANSSVTITPTRHDPRQLETFNIGPLSGDEASRIRRVTVTWKLP